MKRSFLPLFLLCLISFSISNVVAQVGIGTITPNPKAVLELKSPSNNQGFLVPRVTTAQRTAFTGLSANENGLLVFDTDTNKFYYWSGTVWIVIEDSVGTDSQTLSFTTPNLGISGGNSINLSAINTDGQTLTYNPGTGQLTITGGNNVTISGTVPGGTASGDLSGAYPGPTIATGAGNNIVIALNNASTAGTLNTNRLNTAVVLDTESPVAGDVSGSYSGGLQINSNAVTSAEILDGTVTSSDITDATIATADLANTAVTDPKIGSGITVSKLSASATAGQVLTTVGTTTTWATLPDVSATNEIQDLSLTTNTLSLTGDASTVNLAPYLDNTDAQALTFTSPNLSISGGNSVNLSSINTDAQTLSFTSPNLIISGGNSISLSAINTDNQDLTLAGNTLSLTNDATTINLAPYLDNTDNQDLSLATNTLSLTGDATTVNLAPYLDNTDAQALIFTSPNLSISGGNSVNLSTINTDAQTLSFTSPNLSISGGNSINLSTVNTDNQDLTLAGNTLSLTNDATTINLAPYLDNTDNQDLALTGNTLSLTNDGTTVTLAAFLDNTDAQTLSFTPATSTLAISGGNSVSVTATGTAGGDLNGSFPNPTVDGLQGVAVSATGPTTGQVLKYNGASWAPGTDNGSTPALNAVLGAGNNAGAQAAVNFSSISINRADTPGALNVNGSHYTGFTALGTVTNYAVVADDYLIIGTSTGGVQTTATLPDASTCIGRILIFRGRSVGSVAAAGLRVQTASGDTIDGLTITPYLTPVTNNSISITIVAISANEWITISKSIF